MTSSEWHPPLMILSCYTTIILKPLLKLKSQGPIDAPSIFYATITLSERSWIEMMSTFRKKIDRKENLTDPFTKTLRIKEFDHYKSKMGIRYCTDWL